MVLELNYVLFFIGITLTTIGAVFDVIASIGLLRFPEFYVRLHAATIGSIGGAVVPIIGVAILALSCTFLGPQRFFIFGCSIVIAMIIFFVAPVGSHAIARAAYRSRTVVPKYVVHDELRRVRG